MSPKRTPQTAAKRAREQRVREKRELKAAKKEAAVLAKEQAALAGPEGEEGELTEVDEETGEPVAEPNGESPDPDSTPSG